MRLATKGLQHALEFPSLLQQRYLLGIQGGLRSGRKTLGLQLALSQPAGAFGSHALQGLFACSQGRLRLAAKGLQLLLQALDGGLMLACDGQRLVCSHGRLLKPGLQRSLETPRALHLKRSPFQTLRLQL